MSIDWEKGEINERQHFLRPEQTRLLVNAMQAGDISYIDGEQALRADMANGLWLDPNAQVLDEGEVEQDSIDVCRIVLTERGFVIDASADSFKLDPEVGEKIIKDADRDFVTEGWFPVVGVIENEGERAGLAKILFEKYDIILGASALEPPVEVDDAAGPGDEGAAA